MQWEEVGRIKSNWVKEGRRKGKGREEEEESRAGEEKGREGRERVNNAEGSCQHW